MTSGVVLPAFNEQPVELQSYFCRIDLHNVSAEMSAARNPASARKRHILHHARPDRLACFALVRPDRGRQHHRNRDARWDVNGTLVWPIRRAPAKKQQRRTSDIMLRDIVCGFFSDDSQHLFVVEKPSTHDRSSSTAIISRASSDHQE